MKQFEAFESKSASQHIHTHPSKKKTFTHT